MILCKRNAGNSLHIGKFRLRESAGKNCSEAGPDRSCPARLTLCAACSALLAECLRRIRFISRVEHAPHEPSWYAKARIRAHLDILTSCSGFGHLRPSKLLCPRIRKDATCNPSARFGEQRIVDRWIFPSGADVPRDGVGSLRDSYPAGKERYGSGSMPQGHAFLLVKIDGEELLAL